MTQTPPVDRFLRCLRTAWAAEMTRAETELFPLPAARLAFDHALLEAQYAYVLELNAVLEAELQQAVRS